MNPQIRELVTQAGGEFWQRIESDGVLNKEAYITFDPPQSLEKFAELIVKECAGIAYNNLDDTDDAVRVSGLILNNFGVR